MHVRRGLGFSLPMLLPTVSYAADVTPSIGMGRRDISSIEPSIEKYLEERGYTEDIPDIEESVDLEGYWLPYFTGRVAITPDRSLLFAKDRMTYGVDLSFSSSIFGEEEDSDEVPLVYEGTEIGDAQVRWEYSLPFYGSIGPSVMYIPTSLDWRILHFCASINAGGGMSYTHVKADLSFNIMGNTFYEVIGPEMLADEFGIAPVTTVMADASGLGGYGFVAIHPHASVWRFSIDGELGYRLEGMHVSVTETTKGLTETVEEAETGLNSSGVMMHASVGFRF